MFIPEAMPFPSLVNDKLLDVLRLIRTPNVGPVTFFYLMKRFGTAAKALQALPDLSLRGGSKTPLQVCPANAVEKEMDAAAAFGARMIMYGQSEYPKLLQLINDPPPVITVVGNSHLWQNLDMIAIVGARNASAAGCQFAAKLSKELGEAGLSVVSGLARGIDTFVHKGALTTGTIGVIAGGIDNIYPPENAPLFQQMREHGAIISEQPFGSLPFSGSFPGRNRIIAGMCVGTLVAEAALKSGSLITARFATENNREVLAIPGSPIDPRSKGCNKLIKEGAIIVENAGDVLQGIAAMRRTSLRENPAAVYATPVEESALQDNELAAMRRIVIQKLGITAVSVDELVEQCEAPAPMVITVLLELELAGRLKRSSGNKVHLTEIEEEVA